MKPFQNHPKSAPWMGTLLVLAASLALVACDNDMNITGPQMPEFPPADSVSGKATLTGEARRGSGTSSKVRASARVDAMAPQGIERLMEAAREGTAHPPRGRSGFAGGSSPREQRQVVAL